jgi:Holliday junction resolvase-like predicted endonuclease
VRIINLLEDSTKFIQKVWTKKRQAFLSLIYSGAKNLNNSNTNPQAKKGRIWLRSFSCKGDTKNQPKLLRRQIREIDIIAQKERLIVFVEVKSRSNDPFGGGIYSIAIPRKSLKKAAEHFLSKMIIITQKFYLRLTS